MSNGEYPHKGALSINDEIISWKEKAGGHIVFSRNDDAVPVKFSELNLSESDSANLINKLMRHYRPHALPDANQYYAASAGITSDGALFIAVNNEANIKDPYSGRGCAETSMLKKAQEYTGNKEIIFDKVYLMSGMAEKRKNLLIDKERGHLGCPCGECRSNLRSHFSEDGKFVLVPTNDGKTDFSINKTASNANELEESQIWEVSLDKIYPLPAYKTMKDELVSHRVIRQGYDYITKIEQDRLPILTQLPEITKEDAKNGEITISVDDYYTLKKGYEDAGMSMEGLKDNPSLKNINRSMLQLVKKAYNAHSHKISEYKNIDITVTILKTTTGEFIPAVKVDGDAWLPCKPAIMPTALSNAYNSKVDIEEVYMMSFNQHQIENEIIKCKTHELKMPDPSDLGRLIKNLKKASNPKIVIIPANNAQINEAEIEYISESVNVRDAFGIGFQNPKAIMASVAAISR